MSRTHPLLEGLATYVMDTALDPLGTGVARRCGVIRSSKVSERTTLLLLRTRYHLITQLPGGHEQPLLAEDCHLAAFTGSPPTAQWLDAQQAEALLAIEPDANVPPDVAADFLRQVIEASDDLQQHLTTLAMQSGDELLRAHRRVRTAARLRGVQMQVEPQVPPDILGIYVYLPNPVGGR